MIPPKNMPNAIFIDFKKQIHAQETFNYGSLLEGSNSSSQSALASASLSLSPHLFSFKNWRKGPQAKKHEQFQETGKGKDTDSPLESPERTYPCQDLNLSPERTMPEF